MIYCNLSNHGSVTVSAPRLFAESGTNANGDFAYAMEHPIQNIPVTTAGSLSNNAAHADQGIWLGSGDLAGKGNVLITAVNLNLNPCATMVMSIDIANFLAQKDPAFSLHHASSEP